MAKGIASVLETPQDICEWLYVRNASLLIIVAKYVCVCVYIYIYIYIYKFITFS